MSGVTPSGPFDHPVTGALTRADLVDRICGLGYTRRQAAAHVDAVLETICATLADGREVKLSGFGRLEVVSKEAREGRNPQTGAPMRLPARRVVVYRPSPALRDRLTAALAPPEGEHP